MRAVIGIIMLCVVLVGIKAIRENVPVPGESKPPDAAPQMSSADNGTRDAARAVSKTRDDQIADGYAFALTTGYEAQRNCPGLSPDRTALTILRSTSGLQDSDDDWLKGQLDLIKPDIERAIVSKGAKAWCNSAWQVFGPAGLGVIQKDP